jgi:hypothetical protein
MLVGVAMGAPDRAELRIGHVIDRLIEIKVIKDIEGLSADLQLCAFPGWNVEVLHECQIGVEVAKSLALSTRPFQKY